MISRIVPLLVLAGCCSNPVNVNPEAPVRPVLADWKPVLENLQTRIEREQENGQCVSQQCRIYLEMFQEVATRAVSDTIEVQGYVKDVERRLSGGVQ